MSARSIPPPAQAAPAPAARNQAVDTYRGLVMFLMAAEVLRFAQIAKAFPANPVWQFLGFNQSHVQWVGMSLHDTIQPAFTLLVGVALPYSLRSRQRRGQSFGRMFAHTVLRSFILIALGILLRSLPGTTPNFTFEDTLTQIGLGYTFAFLLAFARPRWQWIALGAILFAYWLAWALYPAPDPAFNYAAVGVPPDWHAHLFSGFAAHWNKNSNLGQAFDLWFLNLFPRHHPFLYNAGGYLTLSFIPTLGTQIIGLIAGRWLLNSAPAVPIRRLSLTAVLLIASGLVLHFTGICPIVKRIWTPSWTLFSGGVCLLFLVGLSWLVDLRGHRRIAFPFIVLGTNSIAAYLLSWIADTLDPLVYKQHLWPSALTQFSPVLFSPVLEPLYVGGVTLVLYWLILFAMYKKKIFLRI
jgi:predicted acyltransferase